MDSLCLKAGIHGMPPPIAVVGVGSLEVRKSNPSHISTATVGRSSTGISVEKPSVSSPQRNYPWGFTFRYPLRSLWTRGGKNGYGAAIAVEDAVPVDEKKDKKGKENEGNDEQTGNWVFKILHVRSMWKQNDGDVQINEGVDEQSEISIDEDHQSSECTPCDEECDLCTANDDNDEKADFDRDSFSKLLQKVSLPEARLFARLSYLGTLAYSIPQIKPANLLRSHGLRFVTSSLEKKDQAIKADKEKASAKDQQKEENSSSKNQPEDKEKSTEDQEIRETSSHKAEEVEEEGKQIQSEEISHGNRISAAAAYQIAASAAAYLHSHTKSILPVVYPNKSRVKEDSSLVSCGTMENDCMMNEGVTSLMATTDSVTAVVAAKEEVKQAVADDLNSSHSSPCEWFVCDDDQTGTRFFVIQGSESFESWQANLLFEPIQFEGLDVLVHRGIYEAAKGIYEQMLPEVRAHMKSYGKNATFRFTGHSLGGSLSLLINLMLLIRGEVPPSSLLSVITFGAPAIMCGGDRLLRKLGLPQSHVKSVTLHRDIVPRAFSCHYPSHVAEFLKAVNGNFRSLPCLSNQNLLYAPMGQLLILQPDEKFSPQHDLLPSGSGLYLLGCSISDAQEEEQQIQAAKIAFLNSPHPLEILSDRAAYGNEGTIVRDHDMNSYMRSVRIVIRQELNSLRKARRKHRRRVWWPLVTSWGMNGSSIVTGRHTAPPHVNMSQIQFNFSGILHTGKESLKRFSTLVASQHMHLLVVLLFPARLLILGGTHIGINFH